MPVTPTVVSLWDCTATVSVSANTDVWDGWVCRLRSSAGRHATSAETEKSASYTLPATTVSMWEAANHYRYSFTLTGGGYIVFDPPTVNAWSDAIGGNVTIDVTQ